MVRYFSNGSTSLLSAVELDAYGNIVRATGFFDEYFGSLRPKFARNLKRLERKIRALPGRVLPEEVKKYPPKNPICQTNLQHGEKRALVTGGGRNPERMF